MSADVLKNRTLQMLVMQFLALTSERPTLLLVEDAHWIDPTTTAMLSMLMERIHDVPAMILVTHRPSPAALVAACQRRHLATEPPGQAARLDLAEHVAGKPLSSEVMAQILDKTDGVPLFIEELTKAVLDLGILEDAGDR